METSATPAALVIGASGAIGGAVVDAFCRDARFERVVAVSRAGCADTRPDVTWLQSDHSEASIARIVDELGALNVAILRVVISTGVLHGDTFAPEKKLEQLDAEAMHHVFHVNTVVPALWLSALAPLLKHSEHCVVAATSARVGSIGDNRAGGWYSYRASKAALNMVLKSAAVEYGRRAPGVKLIAFHPGTTDSELSRPFQRGVPEGKLSTPAYVAGQLLSVMENVNTDGELAYLDYAGEPIPW